MSIESNRLGPLSIVGWVRNFLQPISVTKDSSPFNNTPKPTPQSRQLPTTTTASEQHRKTKKWPTTILRSCHRFRHCRHRRQKMNRIFNWRSNMASSSSSTKSTRTQPWSPRIPHLPGRESPPRPTNTSWPIIQILLYVFLPWFASLRCHDAKRRAQGLMCRQTRQIS